MQLTGEKQNVIIYGAGAAGRSLLLHLRAKNEFNVVAFVDDDNSIEGKIFLGVPVYCAKKVDQIINFNEIFAIILAIPSATRQRYTEIYEGLALFNVHVLSMPNLDLLYTGVKFPSDVKEIQIENLLTREIIPPIESLMKGNITDKTVLVTGAGGSIGSELCRQIVQYNPNILILLDVSEFALYAIEIELKKQWRGKIIAVLGSVLDKKCIDRVLTENKVNTIYHAAAYKHVPIVEANPFVGVINNVFGTYNCAIAAQKSNVETFVLISTDKAVRPTNVMGASKRMSELVCQALSDDGQTIFSMVRFGNVLGSSGSVVPLFKEQIEAGGPVTVTHPDVTRYFMTIPEAAQLVIQAGAMGSGGDVFLLDMGEPVKVADLAKRMIHLSGKHVLGDDGVDIGVEIVYTGLRPGEKLFEELLITKDQTTSTKHQKIMRSIESKFGKSYFLCVLEKLKLAQTRDNLMELIEVLEAHVEGYVASIDIANRTRKEKNGDI